MKPSLVLLSLALSAVICLAQQTGSSGANTHQATASESPSSSAATPGSPQRQSQSSGAQRSNSAQQHTISGCLHQSGTAFTLTDSQTGTVYQLSGNTGHLSPHIGHEMQLTGQDIDSGNENATGAPSRNSGKAYKFQVSSQKHLADQCGPAGATANGPSL